MPNPHQRNVAHDIVLIAVFLAALWLPLLDSILRLDPTRLSASRATPVRMPQTFGWREWKKYAGAMKWHLQTTFGFKALLIRLHGIIKVNWLGIPSARGVLIGKDGWYFLRGERIIDDYCGWVPFTDDELGQWKQVLEAREKWFAERGIVYLFLIAPDKHSVYEEYLPDAIARGRGSTRLGQLTEFLQQNSEFRIVDVRPALREFRSQQRLYNRTDSHWNDLGGFVASREVASRLSSWFPAVRPLSTSDCSVSTTFGPGGDIARFLGLKFDLSEGHVHARHPAERVVKDASGGDLKVTTVDVVYRQKVVTECSDGEIPKAVIFRDSFGEALMPWLAQHFRRAVFVWSDEIVPEVIEQEQPDVVIQEFIERRLTTMQPENPPTFGAQATTSGEFR